ncbi:MAG: transposase [Nostoc sp. ChiSLP02]|nr:transposase [Nostoc sp. DedSLP05]MDZ8097818.1 transposase [Nostoc sp. DedSLP01]MDZ8183903.1 transposase [Nostoc sp. ChiSLP02]
MTKPKFQGKYRVGSTRLPTRNYAANGWYFITICTSDRTHFLGSVITGNVQLSKIGEIAQQFWAEIPNHFAYTYTDAYVVMPNHVHGIIAIDRPQNVETLHCNVSTQRDTPCNIAQEQFMSDISPKAGSLGAIVRSYKSAVTRWCGKNGFENFAWQERFYEHIIRADGSLDRIREYIINNPTKWENDKNNPINLWM